MPFLMHLSDPGLHPKRPFHWLHRLAGLTLLLLAAGCAPLPPAAPAPVATARTPVILVSIDGLRPDYLSRGLTPRLSQLAANGVRAEAMMPSFPTKTFPNHYTLVTGLRPDHHGVVDNTMEDPRIPGERFSLGNAAAVTDRRWWDEAEPVWVTAEKHHIPTATMFWPGSEAAIHGVRPTRSATFDGKLSANARTDTLLGWLGDSNAQGFGFLTLYFDDVDHAGHEQGPDSPLLNEALAQVDQAVGRLLDGLAARKLTANIVIVSDHGMAPVSPSRVIRIDQMAPAGSYRVVSSGTFAGLEPAAGQAAVLENALLQPRDHVQCWRKAEIPARFAFGKNARVPTYFCLAEPGWILATNEKSAQRVKGGAHGYDHQAPDMRATFIAAGPAFKNGVVLPPFDNVDVYPLLMQLVGVTPLPSDGRLAPLMPALR
ncbi:ectonucleotide pyrophosphatase/phosphodiesterase [Roseateles amylovorans]|uniref:Ectonucleotide pyrophosphatase/phosphodiesterase n=1 Tax=Roseateles amylovorans TaxID=2978473 RepID=A0ABY6B4A4_9BURK|nr:ectonucleotide pyrophosphatase/phosphodiesterase [Roseateles amylovorans]UXH80019.1 ectonucleotide pyrophosphatase/phosphodiesterase [Roseateles amylovorans]